MIKIFLSLIILLTPLISSNFDINKTFLLKIIEN